MKIVRFISLLILALSIFAVTTEAQRTRRPAPKATPKPTPVRNVTNPVVAEAKQKVSIQLHNVNVFVDRIGPIAVSLEAIDRDVAARRVSGSKATEHENNKKDVVSAFAALRSALVALESEFRTKPLLAQYLPKLQGISGLAADAEDSAIAGKFVAAKDPLREVALKLNDTLAVLPGPAAAGTSTRASSTTTTPVRTVSNPSTSSTPTSRPSTTPSAKGEPRVGMSTAEVTSSTWGAPTSKRTSTSTNGTTEVWTYAGKGTIYFFNGKVTQILR